MRNPGAVFEAVGLAGQNQFDHGIFVGGLDALQAEQLHRGEETRTEIAVRPTLAAVGQGGGVDVGIEHVLRAMASQDGENKASRRCWKTPPLSIAGWCRRGRGGDG